MYTLWFIYVSYLVEPTSDFGWSYLINSNILRWILQRMIIMLTRRPIRFSVMPIKIDASHYLIIIFFLYFCPGLSYVRFSNLWNCFTERYYALLCMSCFHYHFIKIKVAIIAGFFFLFFFNKVHHDVVILLHIQIIVFIKSK